MFLNLNGKTDFSITKNYDEQLVDKSEGLMELGEQMRAKLVQTRQAILDVTNSKDVAGAHVALQRASSQLRHPYIDPVNVVQAELLKRYRKMEKNDKLSDGDEEEKQKLRDALVLSINAIAQGMKNSG
jgi:phosphoenolpyruvate carboxylase